jgi:hypothetical protein
MNGEPRLYKARWHVFTSPDIYQPHTAAGCWAWAAYGPRGSQSGVERSSGVAVNKAQAAAMVLADEHELTERPA